MTVPEQHAGPDLARMALRSAQLVAKSRGSAPGKGSGVRRRKAVRTGGRDPVSFAGALTALMESRGWEAPVTGGGLVDRWADIAPELAGSVRVGRFDADTGVLELLPSSAAYATQVRLQARQLVARINTALSPAGTAAAGEGAAPLVRSVRVLAPGSGTAAQGASSPGENRPSAPADQVGPVHTRESASAGYLRALAVLRKATVEQDDGLPPAVRAAVERQDQVLREGRESEEAFADARELTEHLQQRARAAADPRALALTRRRAEQAGLVDGSWSSAKAG